MRSTHVVIPLILLISACASSGGKAPACSGPRRSANPYGSVLAPTPGKAQAPPTGDGAVPCTGSPTR